MRSDNKGLHRVLRELQGRKPTKPEMPSKVTLELNAQRCVHEPGRAVSVGGMHSLGEGSRRRTLKRALEAEKCQALWLTKWTVRLG